jgi:hypothetical protein
MLLDFAYKIGMITRPATVAPRIVIYKRGDVMNVKFEWGNQICILCGRPEIDPSPRQRKSAPDHGLPSLLKIS